MVVFEPILIERISILHARLHLVNVEAATFHNKKVEIYIWLVINKWLSS